MLTPTLAQCCVEAGLLRRDESVWCAKIGSCVYRARCEGKGRPRHVWICLQERRVNLDQMGMCSRSGSSDSGEHGDTRQRSSSPENTHDRSPASYRRRENISRILGTAASALLPLQAILFRDKADQVCLV